MVKDATCDALFDPHPPHVLFGDTVANPSPSYCVTYYLNGPFAVRQTLCTKKAFRFVRTNKC
jgi:hypothetical protein